MDDFHLFDNGGFARLTGTYESPIQIEKFIISFIVHSPRQSLEINEIRHI